MIASGLIVGIIVVAWIAVAAYCVHRLGITFRQALFYAPLKLVFRIDDRAMTKARAAGAPVIYAVSHQSRLDPALMLALLPADTLHMLDDRAARSWWLEPWRELARTVAFNAGHVFVSRRLVRHLKGNGRLAVYFPDAVEPDQKSFRLYRAVARIAVKSGARIVPIHIDGSRECFASLAPRATRGGRALPRMVARTLEPITLAEATAQAASKRPTNALALFDRMMQARGTGADPERSLFAAVSATAARHGPHRAAFRAGGREISYRTLLMQVRMLAPRMEAMAPPQGAIGVMTAEAASFTAALLAIHSASRAAAPLDPQAGAAAVLAQARMAGVGHVVASRGAASGDATIAAARELESAGIDVVWLDDLTRRASLAATLSAQLFWRRPLHDAAPHQPAIILPAADTTEGVRAPVVSHHNLLSEMGQLAARFGVTPADRLFCAYAPATQGGLTGLLFALVSAVPFTEAPSATVAIAPGAWFVAQAPVVADNGYPDLRAALAGDAQVDAETLEGWRAARGFTILRAYANAATGSMIALASASHAREGTLGRFLTGISARLDPIADLANGGRLFVSGSGVAEAFIAADRPGEIQSRAGEWIDTGDLVVVDREGFVTRLGLAARYANIGGRLVSLEAVEALADGEWPHGSHAAFAVTRDPARGETIVLVTSAAEVERPALRQAARNAGLAAGHVPGEIVRVETLPTTDKGALDRVALAALAAAGAPRRRRAA